MPIASLGSYDFDKKQRRMVDLNKKYETRCRKPVRLHTLDPVELWPLKGVVWDDVAEEWVTYSWKSNGLFSASDNHPYDLVEVGEMENDFNPGEFLVIQSNKHYPNHSFKVGEWVKVIELTSGSDDVNFLENKKGHKNFVNIRDVRRPLVEESVAIYKYFMGEEEESDNPPLVTELTPLGKMGLREGDPVRINDEKSYYHGEYLLVNEDDGSEIPFFVDYLGERDPILIDFIEKIVE